jgi:pimeloyl-ACP methyl ester carboxylesterase
MKIAYKIYAVFLIIFALLYGCSSSSDPAVPEETRLQDSRTFTISSTLLDPAQFTALANETVQTDRWVGQLGGSAYKIEVPKTAWNGKLVMYAHGYVGTVPALSITVPSTMRRYLLDNGYAWAASSYDKNWYDVRSGIEETNRLALNFNSIAAANGRPLAVPTKIYIVGHSMGGHVAAAAVDDEAYTYAVNKVRYNGAVPMCGVVGDTELFNTFAAAQLAAQKLAGFDATTFPVTNWSLINTNIKSALFTSFPVAPYYQSPVVTTALGDKFKGVMMNLSGGSRPMFDQGFAGGLGVGYMGVVWDTFGADGTVNGILNKQGQDTNSFIYQFDANPNLTAEEYAFNVSILRGTAATDSNRLRRDGLRWIPKVNGNFSVPVVTLHTLGDMYVYFKMEQIFRTRADAGTGKNWLVQRAVRGISHCDFTVAETVAAVDAMLKWEQTGVKPTGDDVLTAATVGASNYGCNFTINTTGQDDAATTAAIRASLPACP